MKNEKKLISEEELEKCKNILFEIQKYFRKRIVGQKHLQKCLLICLISNGHILLESVPGLAKTTAAKTLTNAINGKFSRIQCTPDLLPTDIIGTQIFNYSNNKFETKIGPINANFVLLDEINRSSAKTQSASLEAMQEKQITIDGKIFKLPNIFIVIATQNPIEQEGTYILAEAQLDRFLMKEKIDYPTKNEEIEILNRIENNIFDDKSSILNLSDVEYLQKTSKKVYVDQYIKEYISEIIFATRNSTNYIGEQFSKYIISGASTRASITFLECSKSNALMNGRNYVIPDDIKDIRYEILRHRISLNFSASVDDITVEEIIDKIFGAIKTP